MDRSPVIFRCRGECDCLPRHTYVHSTAPCLADFHIKDDDLQFYCGVVKLLKRSEYLRSKGSICAQAAKTRG